MPPFLAEIVAAHRREAAQDRRELGALLARAEASPVPTPFAQAISAAGGGAGDGRTRGLAVIAEVKRRSPSKGDLARDLDPAATGAAYAEGGAAGLSVLTDEAYFGGSAADLAAAKAASGLPVLRKDFTVCEADVCDARTMGADALLLIVAALDDRELAALHALSTSLCLDALVEVHSEPELERALGVGARLVGVNQRDLSTFEVDPGLAERLASRIPPDVVAVAESGIRGPQDASALAGAGYEAVLVGETVVTAADRTAAVRALCGHPVSARVHQGGEPMNGDILVKICGVTNEADALLAVGLGSDAVGFVLAPSPRQIAPSVAGDIVKRLPHEVLTVGVFRDESPRRVVEIANTVGFGAVQLHGHETAEECRWIRARVACTLKAFPAGDRAIGRFAEFGADYLLVDGQSPGSGQVFDWRLAEGVVDPQRMFVSGGLDPDNVADAIAALRPRGVDVSSGVEMAPGKKDPEKLRAFVRNSREAAARATSLAAGPGAGASPRSPDGAPDDPAAPYDWMEG